MGVQINGDTGNISATKADYSGNVTIGGTLTYEDVTNIDSVGLVTARSGIEVGARPGVAASISVDGNMIVSGITTIGGVVNASSNIKVGSGVTLSPDGNIFATGISTFGGAVDASQGVIIDDSITHRNDTNTKIRFPADDTITAETSGSERARIESAGNVNVSQNLNVAGVCTATSFSGSGAALTGISAGITEIDHWYLTSNKTSNGDITANLSRANQTGATIIGSGMAESSGIFTFPSTGKYLIIFTGTFVSVGNDSVRMRLAVTTNNSSYTEVAQCIGGQSHYSGGSANSATASTQFYILDVTDTSNVKVKFVLGSIAGSSFLEAGGTGEIRTGFIFARIGDT